MAVVLRRDKVRAARRSRPVTIVQGKASSGWAVMAVPDWAARVVAVQS
jgi:hypothetical protein